MTIYRSQLFRRRPVIRRLSRNVRLVALVVVLAGAASLSIMGLSYASTDGWTVTGADVGYVVTVGLVATGLGALFLAVTRHRKRQRAA